MNKKILNRGLQIFIWILFIFGVVLAVVAYRGYGEIKDVNSYFKYVRKSSDDLVLSVNDLTNGVNRAQTLGEKATEISEELRQNEDKANEILNRASTEKDQYQVPLDAEDIEVTYDNYLNSVNEVVTIHKEIREAIENTEKEEVIFEKIDRYNDKVKELDEHLEELDSKMGNYSENYEGLSSKLFQKVSF